jgi:AcrR family transcriptional regulator
MLNNERYLLKQEANVPKLKKEYADSRKKEIVKAAWDSFMENGYEKTTMREIARRMDASTGVLYTYYKTKGEILEAMQAGILQRIEQVYAEMNEGDSVRETYGGFFSHEFRYTSANVARKNCKAMVGLLAEGLSSENIRKLWNASFWDIEEGGVNIIEKGIKNGEIHAHVDPRAVIGFFQALEWGMWMQIALIDGLDIKKYTENIVKILMGNIWRDPEASEK